MESRRLFLVLSVLASLQVIVTASTCKVPSQFWCETEDIAAGCGVFEQCKKFQWTSYADAPLVNITLYYESLCPDCKQFITKMLYPTYQKLSAITNLALVPYGNANEKKEGNRWKFTCQHGEQECLGNIIATCTISIVEKISVYFPFLNCMEASTLEPKPAAEKCASQFPVPLEQILNCTTSEHGNELEHKMAQQTDALNPRHTYVPWVTLNGVHTEAIEKEAETDLLKLICNTYKGTKPAACTQKKK